ncbi:pilus assembly protein [Citrobacter freundii]|nr:pilus assembly protein [Citrobacter freundii]
MRKLKRLFSQEDGAATVEFAFVAIPFIITLLFIMELCRIIYIMSSVDLILSETGSETAISMNVADNEKYFNDAVNKMAKGWILLLSGNNVKIQTNIEYCMSIGHFIDDKCLPVSPGYDASATAELAIYSITVPYEPLFFVFPGTFAQNVMTRKIILVQEHKLDRK